jgi:23S rRNA-/tRNA-specific pseudouridylate synthase
MSIGGMTAHQSLEIDLARRVLYRDALMLIIDKPAGLAVHAGGRGRGGQDEGGDHLGRYLDALRFGLPQAPELAHRLDRDTSGCLVLGRHRRALRRLGALFAEGGVEKVYWAAVIGAPPGESIGKAAIRSPNGACWAGTDGFHGWNAGR